MTSLEYDPGVANEAALLPVGIGLRSAHYDFILRERPDVAWFEVLSDNYMNTRGRPLAFLDRVASRYPVALHGVGLSIGSTDPLDMVYLAALRALRERTGARSVSDHIAWTGVGGKFGHDLYPVPFTEECLRHMARRVCQVQDYLEAPLLLENPSTYLQFDGSTSSEVEFIAALVAETGCGLLLDVNNLFVNAFNHGFDAHACLRSLPLERVMQLHLAGHDAVTTAGARGPEVTVLIDTHDRPVTTGVWELFEEAVRLGARAPVLIEWDADIPPFAELEAQARLAQGRIERALATVARGRNDGLSSRRRTSSVNPLEDAWR